MACVMGRCKCKPEFFNENGIRKPFEGVMPFPLQFLHFVEMIEKTFEIEKGERSIPISYAKHKLGTLLSERLVDRNGINKSVSSSMMTLPQTPSGPTISLPRVVGPPIRRLKLQNKSKSDTSVGSNKTDTEIGACPPGNEPTRDGLGRLIMCNGLEPNCPPRSYCYITSGGFATEEYNCCKSW
ncbi:hypothetical protein KIN20_029720 [Parelaphostrongylus tenuis]|uniref:Uncharacterized protein n=1 Tax=Parelaphostrongylus tenuis TaxID=148309 RepID=A0AAD5R3Q3_PARTN|nr:hypothetical protein KIN20_029720 [Parelaphostrongylus tenuis]